jgi:hypothetical protein
MKTRRHRAHPIFVSVLADPAFFSLHVVRDLDHGADLTLMLKNSGEGTLVTIRVESELELIQIGNRLIDLGVRLERVRT